MPKGDFEILTEPQPKEFGQVGDTIELIAQDPGVEFKVLSGSLEGCLAPPPYLKSRPEDATVNLVFDGTKLGIFVARRRWGDF